MRSGVAGASSRTAVLPDVPTAREAGYPALEGIEWFGLFAPAGTSNDIVSSLNAEVRAAMAIDEVKASLAKQAFEPATCTPTEFAELIKSDKQTWAETVKASGFTPMD